LLYATLLKFGFATGAYGATAEDGLKLQDVRITNAVRCVPPQNKPVGAEVKNCRPFLTQEIEAMEKLEIILALGTLAHNGVLSSLGFKQSAAKFGHCKFHELAPDLLLADSYHCSRYNTNTGRLTEEMFCDVFAAIKERL
ncbi:MAG TPA: uracil-DNA glycosylase, partial [Rhodospirillaceae bacterium]|nr:uracil-DNA glycosylase [Rhodospirillaceae bacterium]